MVVADSTYRYKYDTLWSWVEEYVRVYVFSAPYYAMIVLFSTTAKAATCFYHHRWIRNETREMNFNFERFERNDCCFFHWNLKCHYFLNRRLISVNDSTVIILEFIIKTIGKQQFLINFAHTHAHATEIEPKSQPRLTNQICSLSEQI